jgi:putative DNA primase/helicase
VTSLLQLLQPRALDDIGRYAEVIRPWWLCYISSHLTRLRCRRRPAANHKPTIRGTDNAIWRRIRLIPFTVTIPPEKQDRDLVSKLRKELPAILAWAIEGCLAWQEEGLIAPEPVRAATEDYRAEMDVLASFLEDRCLVAANASVSAKDLYASYRAWCEETGEYCHTQTRFGRMLVERGFSKDKLGTVRYVGLGLREPAGVGPWS